MVGRIGAAGAARAARPGPARAGARRRGRGAGAAPTRLPAAPPRRRDGAVAPTRTARRPARLRPIPMTEWGSLAAGRRQSRPQPDVAQVGDRQPVPLAGQLQRRRRPRRRSSTVCSPTTACRLHLDLPGQTGTGSNGQLGAALTIGLARSRYGHGQLATGEMIRVPRRTGSDIYQGVYFALVVYADGSTGSVCTTPATTTSRPATACTSRTSASIRPWSRFTSRASGSGHGGCRPGEQPADRTRPRR